MRKLFRLWSWLGYEKTSIVFQVLIFVYLGRNVQVERWNSKGRSGYSFDWIYKFYFVVFLVIQVWLTHQSKALIFYFGMKNFFNLIFENLWKTDKMNFTSSNLMCVYTHSKFQNKKSSLSVSHKTFKNWTQKLFSCQNRKSELLIDGLIIPGSFEIFDVRKRQNKFCKFSQNCNLSALLNFTSLLAHFCLNTQKSKLEIQ